MTESMNPVTTSVVAGEYVYYTANQRITRIDVDGRTPDWDVSRFVRELDPLPDVAPSRSGDLYSRKRALFHIQTIDGRATLVDITAPVLACEEVDGGI